MYAKNKYCLTWKTHAKHVFKSLCCLMEHQTLVDIAICCGNKTLHAHKCVLAANSHYFKEEMENNPSVEQIIITGFDFTVLRAIIEFMYCGETTINEEDVKYLIAAAKVLQIRGLDTLFSDRQDYQRMAEDVYIPYPQFITSKPKYPIAFHSLSNSSLVMNEETQQFNVNKKKTKRRYLRSEAEKACAKEAHASRMALANLQKEIATTSQANSFIIEESCTETTVENFIPHTEDLSSEVTKSVPIITFTDSDPGFPSCNPTNVVASKPSLMHQFAEESSSAGGSSQQRINPDKLKSLFGAENSSNIEIIFKTNDGNFMTVNEEVLQTISKGGLQYQIVDENGHVGEIQELKPVENGDSGRNIDLLKNCMKNTKIVCENDASSRCENGSRRRRGDQEEEEEGVAREVDDVEEESTLNERKPIQFMLLDNGEFDQNLMNSFTSNQTVKISLEGEEGDGNDEFSSFVEEFDIDGSDGRFSPDIFFSEEASSDMPESVDIEEDNIRI